MVAVSTLYDVAAVGAVGVIALAFATRTSWLQKYDDRIENDIHPHRPRWRRVAGVATLTGEWFVHPLIAILAAVALAHYRPGNLKPFLIALGAASISGMLVHRAVKFVYHRHRAEVALKRNKTEAAYPSGHTTNSTSVVMTATFLLVHEHVVSLGVALPVAVAVCVATGASRVLLGWHWTTDVIGGWMAGIGIASLASALYLTMR